MPCFDKKLEGSRKSNRLDEETLEVDVVVSTEEFSNLLTQLADSNPASNPQAIPTTPTFFDRMPVSSSLKTMPIPSLNHNQFYGSDSYLNYIYRRLEHEHNLPHIPDIAFSKYRGRNKDFNICQLVTPDKTYKFAAVYGFKSIQNLIRLIKTKKCDYDYIEIMACPSGCLNGGGQIKYKNVVREEQLEKLAAVEFEFLKSGLLTWPDISSENLKYFESLKFSDYTTYFSDPSSRKVDDSQPATGQNLIIMANTW